ncbi:MAG TPA: copper resistance protein NlpE N-terminal domain-containing protein [Woeseiaceae bacterium]|nr:copper resistance protein NlpE N-terminal domain-containing protein [Woeseiaceae bacterium]
MTVTAGPERAPAGRRAALALLAACMLLPACGRDEPAPAPAAPDPATLPGVWAGVYPCADCPGIETRLWLRPDGRFFLEQRYLAGADGDPAAATHNLGRWQWDPGGRVLSLAGAGPVRRFERPSADRLEFGTAVPEPHMLTRQAGSTNFSGVLAVEGTVRRAGDGYVLAECLTGYEVPVATGGDYARFVRQFRNVVPRGAATLAHFEGRYTWNAAGGAAGFQIERFVTLRPGGACREPT